LHEDGRNGTGEQFLYIERFFLMRKHRVFGAFLHKIWASDPEGVHDHPWWNFSLVLRGGYWEEDHTGRRKWMGPGSMRFRTARELHRLELDPEQTEPTISFFVYGKRERDWGWLEHGKWIRSPDNAAARFEPLRGFLFPHADELKVSE